MHSIKKLEAKFTNVLSDPIAQCVVTKRDDRRFDPRCKRFGQYFIGTQTSDIGYRFANLMRWVAESDNILPDCSQYLDYDLRVTAAAYDDYLAHILDAHCAYASRQR
jgi:hypothetical protein